MTEDMQEFQIKGKGFLIKDVIHYHRSSSRIYVPSSWNRVAVIHLKDKVKEE